MIVVVGPSGAGKDSVMSFAAVHYANDPDINFVRRLITRAADAGSEDHDSISDQAFDELRDAGAFAVSWEAHGLKYGIPAETILRIEAGAIVIANGSRAALPAFEAAYPKLVVVNITASPDVLTARLSNRGRETVDEVRARLARPGAPISDKIDLRTIDNSGRLEDAGEAFVEIIQSVK